MVHADAEQLAIACVLMRAGTSKALFFHERDLPGPGAARDRLLLRVMGSPDPLQIDGMGGARPTTSKVAIVAPSRRLDADVDYTFAQVDIERALVGHDGNCGNVSAGVGPFAIDEGLVPAVAPVTTVRIYNTNTGKLLYVQVPVAAGRARVSGDCVIAGVPGTGAEILMDYSGTVGAMSGKLLPTGRVCDMIALEDGRVVEVTICDVANPCVFVDAAVLDDGLLALTPSGAPPAALSLLAELQAKAGALMGLWSDWRAVAQPGLPLAVAVDGPADETDLVGLRHNTDAMDLRARLVFVGRCHDSMAGTGALCTAAAACLPGSVVRRAARPGATLSGTLRIGHPSGVMQVQVRAQGNEDITRYTFPVLGIARTARRLMTGQVFVPYSDLEDTGAA